MQSRVSLTAVVLLAVVLAATGAVRLTASDTAAPPGVTDHFRIAVSVRNLGDEVNENDARVAFRLWANAVARQSGMQFEYPPTVISSSEEIIRLIRRRAVDAFALATEELLEVAPLLDPGSIIVDERYAGGGEEYLLLVHRDSPCRGLAELAGKSLLMEHSIRAGLAMPWLETALATAHKRPVAEFFGRVTPVAKPAKVVLPVFFRQTDACLVARRSFDVMCELNPQLKWQLRSVAVSPRLIPVFLGFHRDCPREYKERVGAALTNLQATPYGRQALTFFQCKRLVAVDTSVVQRSVDLLLRFQRETKGAGRR